MATKKPNPFAKMTEAKDKATDKKKGVKENSSADTKKDVKMGIKPFTKKK